MIAWKIFLKIKHLQDKYYQYLKLNYFTWILWPNCTLNKFPTDYSSSILYKSFINCQCFIFRTQYFENLSKQSETFKNINKLIETSFLRCMGSKGTFYFQTSFRKSWKPNVHWGFLLHFLQKGSQSKGKFFRIVLTIHQQYIIFNEYVCYIRISFKYQESY